MPGTDGMVPFWPGVRYLSIYPTNMLSTFMVGFIGPFVCGACVVPLEERRPEFVRDAFMRYALPYVALFHDSEESGARASGQVR